MLLRFIDSGTAWRVDSAKSLIVDRTQPVLVHGKRVLQKGFMLLTLISKAWVRNATIKDNILFHRNLDEPLYHRVLNGCALHDDLQVFPAGDETEIGENGINLSGLNSTGSDTDSPAATLASALTLALAETSQCQDSNPGPNNTPSPQLHPCLRVVLFYCSLRIRKYGCT